MHTTAIANSSRPEPVYMRAQINLTISILNIVYCTARPHHGGGGESGGVRVTYF